jgi:hypothetical protein
MTYRRFKLPQTVATVASVAGGSAPIQVARAETSAKAGAWEEGGHLARAR